jgi:diacylglycerol kinase (ATP)
MVVNVPKICLIYNAQAGSGEDIHRVLSYCGNRIPGDIYPAHGPDDTQRLAREAIDRGFQRLVIAGGDGTINVVINALAPRFAEIELALLPLGTGNDLARSLDVPLDDIEQAVRLACRGTAVPIDLGRVEGGGESYFVNAASGGVGGTVASDIAAAEKIRWGAFAYWRTAITKLAQLSQFHVEVRIEEQFDDQQTFVERTFDLPLYGIIIANGRYVGGGFEIAPRARLNDGLLDVTTIPVLPPAELLAAGLNFGLQRFDQATAIKFYRVRRISIASHPEIPFSVDGEPMRTLNATFEVIPGGVRMVAGESAALKVDQRAD